MFIISFSDSHVGDSFKKIITHSFTKITLLEDKLSLITNIMKNVTGTSHTSDNVGVISKIWLSLTEELVSDFTVEQIENFSNFESFFMWPVYQLSELDDHMKKVNIQQKIYVSLYLY